MKKVVLFLLVNGIGFGHFKRALVIAESFDKSEYDIRFIVQASSIDIFRGRNYVVYAFPLLYSVKYNNARDVIYNLLNSLIYKLSPIIVFEDTYPEDDYLNLPAISNTPRMMIMRRVDNHHLENMLFDGYLSSYDLCFFMDKKDRIIDSVGNYIVKNFLNYSDKCKYIGDVFDKSCYERKKIVYEKYHLSQYKKNVVFNCGAGGWHKGENVCKKIFNDGLEAITKIAETHPDYQFIFIAGSYSGWSLPSSKKIENIRVEQYEDELSSLMQSVDICVIRPGYNAVMECLSGGCDVILLPSISYMEKQNDWCDQLVKDYGLYSIRIGDVEELHNTICRCLLKHSRNSKEVESNEKLIVNYVLDYLNQIEKFNTECILSLSKSAFSHDSFGELCLAKKCIYLDGKCYPIINTNTYVDYLDYIGKIVVVYNDENHEYEGMKSICKRIDLFAYGIIPIDVYELKYITYNDAILKINTLLKRGIIAINIVFDEARDDKEAEYLDYIEGIIRKGRIKIVSISQIVQKVMAEQYDYRRSFQSIGIKGLE